jgi:hypothetical protein
MAVQRRIRTQYERQLPTWKSIRFWDNKERIAGSLLRVQSPGKARTSEENVNRIRGTFQRSPRKAIRAASLQPQIPRSILHNVLHKMLRLRPYKIQMIHALKPSDQVACTNFWTCEKELMRHSISSAKCASQTRRRSMSMEL